MFGQVHVVTWSLVLSSISGTQDSAVEVSTWVRVNSVVRKQIVGDNGTSFFTYLMEISMCIVLGIAILHFIWLLLYHY